MSTLKFTKPFDLQLAMAGAPISTTSRGPAKFVAYTEAAHESCCLIILNENGIVGTRRKSGRVNETGAIENPHDLVMIPLGMIDGKPVFVGDEMHDRWGNTIHAYLGMGFNQKYWFWPAPTKVYPVTQMTDDDMAHAICDDGKKGSIAGDGAIKTGMRVANAALRHAIDTEQVIPIAEVREVARMMNRSQRAARDMAIAEAVRAADRRAITENSSPRLACDVEILDGYLAANDLTAIIAQVPA